MYRKPLLYRRQFFLTAAANCKLFSSLQTGLHGRPRLRSRRPLLKQGHRPLNEETFFLFVFENIFFSQKRSDSWTMDTVSARPLPCSFCRNYSGLTTTTTTTKLTTMTNLTTTATTCETSCPSTTCPSCVRLYEGSLHCLEPCGLDSDVVKTASSLSTFCLSGKT